MSYKQLHLVSVLDEFSSSSYMQTMFTFSLSDCMTCFISAILIMLYLVFPLAKLFGKLLIFPTLSFSLSFHTLIALVHPLHGNPYSSHWHQLMGISIARWLATSMWDFLLFCVLHTTSTIIFYSTYSAISMAHAHVLPESWKGLRTLKVWNNCLACHWGCAWWNTLCGDDGA